ncbi:PTS sugar transporter subunit IIB [Collinsella sp. AGMB00827]|uniref:PTS sugar transporter subunit IIB n=1 Tax=Collinsella ureilytica TaxID=2869515 RepID=A0ABS7MLQ2_9ACTN|nr:PTS sugar transporter subunit IIB [Collinsella urealyticum]MBY4798238.1 PTS sugar transporter subunit IIB [Collinsella urealyticum]
MKTIIVACGGGIATSATVATKINDRLEDRGLASQAKVEAIDIKSLDTYINNADLYVSITPTPGSAEEYSIPVVSGMPFLIGVGVDEAIDEIVRLLNL